MNFIKEWSGVVALVILAISGLSGTYVQTFGSASACTDGYTCYTNVEVQGNLITDGTATLSGNTAITGTLSVSATTTDAGNVVITTSNTATSSLQVGCIQTTATSTATPLKLVITAISTTTTTFGNGTSGLAVVAAFGKCPGI